MKAGKEAGIVRFAAGMTRAAAQAELRRALTEASVDSPALDARLLLGAALGASQTALLAHADEPLSRDEAARLGELARRRLAREPMARITGQAEFWGLPFRLSPETLAPRPDTESVVEAALAAVGPAPRALRILDLGTGTGCILVALLSELPDAFGIGLDRSPGALSIAKANAQVNGVSDRTAFVASDWGAALDGRFDLIVSNPPYIRAVEIQALAPEVSHFDPPAALDGGRDGLDAYRSVLDDAGRLLTSSGRAVLELGHDQAGSVGALAEARGFTVESLRRDLGGHSRAMALRRPGHLVSGE